MCDKDVLENGGTLKSVPDSQPQKQNKTVMKQLIITLMHWNLSLNL